MTFCLSPSLSSLVHYQFGLLDGRTAPIPRLWIRSAEVRGGWGGVVRRMGTQQQQFGLINRAITKCHVIISYYFWYHLLSHTMYWVPYYSLYSSVRICDNVFPAQRLSALMDWKPEVIYLTGERLSCPHATWNWYDVKIWGQWGLIYVTLHASLAVIFWRF